MPEFKASQIRAVEVCAEGLVLHSGRNSHPQNVSGGMDAPELHSSGMKEETRRYMAVREKQQERCLFCAPTVSEICSKYINIYICIYSFSAPDAECRGVAWRHSAILPSTHYEIGLAQKGLSGFPILTSWRWCRQRSLLFWLSWMDKHSFAAGNYPSSNINKWGFLLFQNLQTSRKKCSSKSDGEVGEYQSESSRCIKSQIFTYFSERLLRETSIWKRPFDWILTQKCWILSSILHTLILFVLVLWLWHQFERPFSASVLFCPWGNCVARRSGPGWACTLTTLPSVQGDTWTINCDRTINCHTCISNVSDLRPSCLSVYRRFCTCIFAFSKKSVQKRCIVGLFAIIGTRPN